MSEDNDIENLTKNIGGIMKGFGEIHKKAEAMSVFLNDRELLSCNKCNLIEDVDFSGRLFTYIQKEKIQSSVTFDKNDSKMRFVEIEKHKTYKCPNCESIIDYIENGI